MPSATAATSPHALHHSPDSGSDLGKNPVRHAAPDSASTRVCLFTDTLGDVNGVSRFIRNVAEQAWKTWPSDPDRRCELHAITSTRFECPAQPNIHNLRPRYTRPMPGYATLDVVVPDSGALMRLADRLRPTVVHVSTPGPVGYVGRRYALKRGLPIVGTYHTDFPAYIDHLFNDAALSWVCTQSMRHFYRPFTAVFSRSDDYARALVNLGVAEDRIHRLLPGIDTDTFTTRYRDPSGAIWRNIDGVRPASVKALYVGRVSVEKNLPLLTRLWPQVRAAAAAQGVDTQLLIVGDGPYRAPMTEALRDHDTVFLGFRFGVELSTIYASSDLFVFPSTTDTLGQVVMESQAAGLPVVVTDQGGPSEVVDDGVTGLVLPVAGAGAEARWVRELVRLITNAGLRARMGAAGAAKIAPMSIRHSFEHFWSVHQRVHAAHIGA